MGLISGGISNALFKLTPAGGGLAPVALRVYGDSTEHFIDRQRELLLMSLLHRQGFGPKVSCLPASAALGVGLAPPPAL